MEIRFACKHQIQLIFLYYLTRKRNKRPCWIHLNANELIKISPEQNGYSAQICACGKKYYLTTVVIDFCKSHGNKNGIKNEKNPIDWLQTSSLNILNAYKQTMPFNLFSLKRFYFDFTFVRSLFVATLLRTFFFSLAMIRAHEKPNSVNWNQLWKGS